MHCLSYNIYMKKHKNFYNCAIVNEWYTTYTYAIFQIALKNLRLLFNKKNSLEIKIRKHGVYIKNTLSLLSLLHNA